jgi:drug/metabolite transporter (DMT)-like permease
VAAGILFALLTSVSWAFGNVYVQKSGRAVGAPRAMLWALLVGSVVAGALSAAFDVRTAPITAAVIAWTLVAALFGLLAYVCLFWSFARSPLSLAVPVISSWSLISGALSYVAFDERLRPRPLLGAALVLGGVLLVSSGSAHGTGEGEGGKGDGGTGGGEGTGGGDSGGDHGTGNGGGGDGTGGEAPALPRGRLWVAFGAAIGFGVMVPALTRVTPATGEFGATASVYALGLLLGAPLARALGVDLRPPPRAAWPLVVATGAFETLGFVAIAFARRHAPMAVVSPVSSLAASFTVLYAWAVLHERPPRLAAVGAVFACVGVVILAT